MAAEPEDMGSQGVPPSFVPSDKRQRRTSRTANNPMNAASDNPAGIPAQAVSPQSAQQQSAAQQSAPQQSAVPPSFIPAARRRSTTPSAASSASAVNAAESPVATPARKSGQAAQDIPQSFQPAQRPIRRTSGSSRTAPAQRPVTPGTTPVAPYGTRSAMPRANAASPRAGTVPFANGTAAGAAVRPPKRRHIGRLIIAVLLSIVLLAALGTFGVWNWIDGKLVKAPWLTDRADTPASTWLVLGSDEREGGDSDITGSRSDTILVLTKPEQGASSLISIPRDSLVSVEGYSMKINAVGELYDNRTMVSAVEQITGQKIDHVAQIKFNGLTAVVDALGGIELCYDSDVSDPYSGLEWQAGCHMADGTTALAFSRMRYADVNGDFGRGERQRQVIGAIMKKGLSSETLSNPGTIMSVADTTLNAVTVDESTNPYTLLTMALAFRDATGENGVTGSVYWIDPGYYVDGVGSSVLLDDQRNLDLFSQLADGSHAPGTVGTLAENQ